MNGYKKIGSKKRFTKKNNEICSTILKNQEKEIPTFFEYVYNKCKSTNREKRNTYEKNSIEKSLLYRNTTSTERTR